MNMLYLVLLTVLIQQQEITLQVTPSQQMTLKHEHIMFIVQMRGLIQDATCQYSET
jgi:hypothetical protein